jgi:ribosome-associated translation inhibitor RaiA
MQVQVNTDHNIDGRESLVARITEIVESSLGRVSAHITRVEVHLSDEDGRKSGQNDKRCVMEARIEGRQPIAVTEHANTLQEAVNGAAERLTHLIDNVLVRAMRSETIARFVQHRVGLIKRVIRSA